MDDEDLECDTETCMIVEIQENELGEIVLVERPREEVFGSKTFCVVEPSRPEPCEVTVKTENLPDNIEIVYLPDYENGGGPIILKQELAQQSDSAEPECIVPDRENYEAADDENERFVPVRPGALPKVHKRDHKRTLTEIATGPKKAVNGVVPKRATRWKESRLRSDPNVVVRRGGAYRPFDRPWSRKLDAKEFVRSKGISSVTTIHTRPRDVSETDDSEHEAMPDGKVPINNTEPGTKRMSNSLPHKCQYCDRSFRQSVSLQIHSTRHRRSIPDGCRVS